MGLFVLDTDHLSLYQRGSEPLVSRMLSSPPGSLAITIVTVEEQMRGRLAQVRAATTTTQLSEAYRWLTETFHQLSRLPVLHFDSAAAAAYERLRANRVRIGVHDLRIAAIVSSRADILLTRNKEDFARITNLQFEDWTV